MATKRDESALRIFFNQALHKDPALRFQDVDSYCRSFFSIRFRATPSRDSSEARTHFIPSFVQTLRNLRVSWMEQVDRFRQSSASGKKLRSRFAQANVESILAHQNVRKHPRVKVSSENVSADVFAPDIKWKLTQSVEE